MPSPFQTSFCYPPFNPRQLEICSTTMGIAYQNRKESIAKSAVTKSKVYRIYGSDIYVCTRSGGTAPSSNLALRGPRSHQR